MNKKEKAYAATLRWRKSPEGRKKYQESLLRYKNSLKAKETRKKYAMSERRKSLNRFYKSKEEYKLKQRIYRINPENRLKERANVSVRMENPEIKLKAREASLKWRRSDKGREWMRNYERSMRKTSVQFKVSRYLRSRVYRALKYQSAFKLKATFHLIGCSPEFLIQYLESKFHSGMSWKNYGKIWHVDHIIPCIKFDLSSEDNQKRCFHYSNLQPLGAFENFSKNGKILGSVQEELLFDLKI